MKTIFRAEAIGSLLRPEYLWNARRSLRSKQITTAEFKKIEDRAVDEAIALQEAAGLDVVTDGEVRRLSFIGPLAMLCPDSNRCRSIGHGTKAGNSSTSGWDWP